MTKAKKSEDRIQTEFMNWARWMAKFHDPRFRLMHHVPNGGNRSAREGQSFKLMGVVPGIPDIHWPVASCHPNLGLPIHSLYIEFKRPEHRNRKNGGLSDDQVSIIAELKSQGNRVEVCYSKYEAIAVVESYLGQKLPRRPQDISP
jgi:hypothetical protein